MPLPGYIAPGRSGPSIWRRLLYPHSLFGLVARHSATHKRTQTVRPNHRPALSRRVERRGEGTPPSTPFVHGVTLHAAPAALATSPVSTSFLVNRPVSFLFGLVAVYGDSGLSGTLASYGASTVARTSGRGHIGGITNVIEVCGALNVF